MPFLFILCSTEENSEVGKATSLITPFLLFLLSYLRPPSMTLLSSLDAFFSYLDYYYREGFAYASAILFNAIGSSLRHLLLRFVKTLATGPELL